jgi:hypothetical protein
LLLGRGVDLLRVSFGGVVRLESAAQVDPAGAAVLRVHAQGPGVARAEIQLEFQSERVEAQQAVERAKDHEAAGRLGQAIASYREVLDRFPYDAKLVAEAETGRARLTSAGVDALAAVRAEYERAGFFGLAEIYGQCAQRAAAVAERWSASEIEHDARALIGEIEQQGQAQGAQRSSRLLQRLEGVLQALDAARFPKLRARLDQARTEAANAPAAALAAEGVPPHQR